MFKTSLVIHEIGWETIMRGGDGENGMGMSVDLDVGDRERREKGRVGRYF